MGGGNIIKAGIGIVLAAGAAAGAIVAKIRFGNTRYDEYGYDKEGYNKQGYNRFGYNRKGYNKYGFDKDGFNKYGFNVNGFDKDGFNISGYNQYGYDRDGFDKKGFNKNGFDKNGFDENGFTIEGLDRTGSTQFDRISIKEEMNKDLEIARKFYQNGDYNCCCRDCRTIMEGIFKYYTEFYQLPKQYQSSERLKNCFYKGIIADDEYEKAKEVFRYGNMCHHKDYLNSEEIDVNAACFTLKTTEEAIYSFSKRIVNKYKAYETEMCS